MAAGEPDREIIIILLLLLLLIQHFYSAYRVRGYRGVIVIGLKFVACFGFDTFGMGVMAAVLHWRGTTPSDSDWSG